ncbi:hypothetical protein IG631_16783 [Alternaria alternata]|nr:hypothetical protein IG631_16783 [Alternaria alternata]
MLAWTTPTALLFSIDLNALRTIFSVIPSLALNGSTEIMHGHFCLRRVPWYVLSPAHSNNEVRLACTSLYVMPAVLVLVSTGLLARRYAYLRWRFGPREYRTCPSRIPPNSFLIRQSVERCGSRFHYYSPTTRLYRHSSAWASINHGADHGGNSREWLPHCFLTRWTRSHEASCSPR